MTRFELTGHAVHDGLQVCDLKKIKNKSVEISHTTNLKFVIQDRQPYLVTFVIRTPTFEWNVVWCGSKNKTKSIHVQKRLKCTLKHDNHSRFWKNLATRKPGTKLVGLHNWKEFNGQH